MSDNLIPTPWGVLVDVTTGDTIGPATEEQWRYRQDNPGAYLTLPDGRQADVTAGPPVLACGHTEADHDAQWDNDRRRVVAAIAWAVDNQKDDELIELPAEHYATIEDDQAALVLFPIVAGLLAKEGLPPVMVGLALGTKQAPVAAIAIVHLTRVMAGTVELNRRFPLLVSATTPNERLAVVETAMACIENLGMSTQEFGDWAHQTTRDIDHG